MKEDTLGCHASGFLPILDTQMGVVDGQIVHHHYVKPMAALELTLRRSAMSKASKYVLFWKRFVPFFQKVWKTREEDDQYVPIGVAVLF